MKGKEKSMTEIRNIIHRLRLGRYSSMAGSYIGDAKR